MATNENIEINKKDDRFLIAQGSALVDNAKTSMDLITERMRKDNDLYDGKFTEQERKWSKFLGVPRIFVKKTYTNVQRILVDVIDTFFFDPEEIIDISSWKSIPAKVRQVVKTVINYRLNSHPINFYHELYEAGQDAIRNSMCAFKIFPDLLLDKNGKIKAYEPRFDCIPPEDILVSSKATWKNYYKYPMVHRYKKTRDELKRKGYKNVDIPAMAEEEISGNELKTQRHEDYGSPFSKDNLVKAQDEVWVYEIWDHLPGEDGLLESGSYILLGSSERPEVLARGWQKNELPYKASEFELNRPPFVLGFAFPESHKLKGKSFPEITEAQQKDINAHRNQMREMVARFLRPTTYINREANVDLMSLTLRRIGGHVQGDGPPGQSVAELPAQNPFAAGIPWEGQIQQDYSEVGIPPNLLGASSNEETATAASQQLNNAVKKVSLIIKNLAYTALLPGFRMLLRLEQTYASDKFINEATGRILGWRVGNDNFPAKEAIQGDYDFKINLGLNKQAQINKELLIADRMNQANQVLFQLVQSGVVNPGDIKFKNPMKLFERMLPALGEKNIEEFDIQAQKPLPGAGPVPGIASQPRNVNAPEQAVTNINPEGSNLLDVI